MKYTFVYKESQDGTPTLIVYDENYVNIFGGTSPRIINVITGERATEVFNYLTGKAEEVEKND
jgi:hypothetical protein